MSITLFPFFLCVVLRHERHHAELVLTKLLEQKYCPLVLKGLYRWESSKAP